MRGGQIDVTPLVTHSKALSEFGEAFELASDRNTAIKVQIAFS